MAEGGQKAEFSSKRPYVEVRHMVEEVITILSSDVYRLQKQNSNIAKMYMLEEWSSLDVEHIEAWRTAQEVRSNTKRLLKIRTLIVDEDHQQFEISVKDTRDRAVKALADFLKLQRKLTSRSESSTSGQGAMTSGPTSLQHGTENPRRGRAASDSAVLQPESMPHLTDSPGYTRQASEGGQTSTSPSFLETGANIGKYALPAIGGVLGTMFAGPVGLAIGVKLGAVAAVGGGIAGVAGGKMLQSQHDELLEEERGEDAQDTCRPLESHNNDDSDADAEVMTDDEGGGAETGETPDGEAVVSTDRPVQIEKSNPAASECCPTSGDAQSSPEKFSAHEAESTPANQKSGEVFEMQDMKAENNEVTSVRDENTEDEMPQSSPPNQTPLITDTEQSGHHETRGVTTEAFSGESLTLEPPPDIDINNSEDRPNSLTRSEESQRQDDHEDGPQPLVLPCEPATDPSQSLLAQEDTDTEGQIYGSSDSETAEQPEPENGGDGIMASISDFFTHPSKKKLAAVALPIAGGVVGTALAGPVGFLAGAKLATLGAFTGSVLGATTGKILQNASAEGHFANDSEQQYGDSNQSTADELTKLDTPESIDTNQAGSTQAVAAECASNSQTSNQLDDPETPAQSGKSVDDTQEGDGTAEKDPSKDGEQEGQNQSKLSSLDQSEVKSESLLEVQADSDKSADTMEVQTTIGCMSDTVAENDEHTQQPVAEDATEDNPFVSKLNDFACFIDKIDGTKVKMVALPVLGGVLGTAVAGPLGLLAGLKIGTAGAVGGGVLGMKLGEVVGGTKSDETATQALASPQKDPSQQDDQQQGTSDPQKHPELTEQKMTYHDTNQQSLKDFQEKEENLSGTSQQEIPSQQEVSNHEPQNEFLETDKSNSDTNQGECLEPNKQDVLNEEDLERGQDNVSHQIEEEVSHRKGNNAVLNEQDVLEKEKLALDTNQQDVSLLQNVQQEVIQKPEQEGSVLQNVHPEDLHDEHNPDLTALNAAPDQQELLQEILDEPIKEGCPSVPVVLEKDQSTSKTESVGNDIDDESLE